MLYSKKFFIFGSLIICLVLVATLLLSAKPHTYKGMKKNMHERRLDNDHKKEAKWGNHHLQKEHGMIVTKTDDLS